MYRLFVAIDLPDDVKSELASFCFGLPGARWVDDDQLHLTLRFIGEADGALFEEIREALATIEMAPFSFQLKGAGHFPPRGMPQVLWIGVQADEKLLHLRSKVNSVLRQLGLESEKRKFSPHITVARLRNTSRSRIATFLAANNLYASRVIEVGAFHLYSSTLTSKGAIHTLEAAYALD